MTTQELLQYFRDHPLPPILAALAAAAGAGFFLHVHLVAERQASDTDIRQKYERCEVAPKCAVRAIDKIIVAPELPSGADLKFVTSTMLNMHLAERDAYTTDLEWDLKCKDAAYNSLEELHFKPISVPSRFASRGELNHIHLGVQCVSRMNIAVVYGVAKTEQSVLLQTYATALKGKIESRLDGFYE